MADTLTSPLPSSFKLEHYTLLSVIEQDDLFFLYDARSGSGAKVRIKEFCPRSLAVRDEESGKLRYPDSAEIREEVMKLKEQFDSFPDQNLQEEISALGTVYKVLGVAQPAPVQRKKTKSGNGGAVIILLILLIACGYIGYHFLVEEKQLQQEPENTLADPQKPVELEKKKVDVVETVDIEPAPVDIGKEEPAPEPPPAANEEPTVDPVAETPQDDPDAGQEPAVEPDQQQDDTPSLPEYVPDDEPTAKKENQGKVDSNVVKNWLAKYGRHMPLKQWGEQYEGVHQNWFGDAPEVAERYITTLGPLGIRARQLDSTWASNASFRAQFPEALIDDAGELVLNVYDVTQVIKGSPADGKVKPGDLIVAMDGELLKTAASVKLKTGPYQHQGSRGLDLHAGLLIDHAEGKGEITLTILPRENLSKISKLTSSWKRLLSQRIDDGKTRKDGLDIKIPVKGGQIVRLFVTDGDNGNGSDGFNWADLRLEGKKGVYQLNKATPSAYQVGWGEAKYDQEKKEWLAHAPSVLSFEIPPGEWTFKGRAVPGGSCTVEAGIDLGLVRDMPATVKTHTKNVKLKIDRLGSYSEGFPRQCAKTRSIVSILAGWMAAQQNENGSWDRPAGYTNRHYDTALGGLALMATGDKQYDEHIKKAAHFIAFSGTQDWWAVPASTASIFLAEYWLRYKDNSVLPALRNQVERLKSDMLYGDFNTGHGIHPGYRGTGVSVGGSHMTLALALANKTPARIEDGILDKMLNRAQELGPAGFIPYGRTAEVLSFEPHVTAGATYSGRHGPYFIASLISGGPALFTKNCRAMYAMGPIGGGDQGHSTETLSLLWAFPALWNADPQAYYRNMEAFRWKLALMRTFDGGMCFNPNRTELMTADGVLHVYIRTAAWIIGLCADRQQLAVTGKPEYRAKTFREVPPIMDQESRLLSTYIRNWSMAAAALGDKAPAGLTSGCAELKKIPVKNGCRYPLMEYISKNGVAVAKSILSLSGVDPLLKNYTAEMVLGVDVRIDFDPAREEDKTLPGSFQLQVDVQQPMGGRSIGLKGEDADKANNLLKWKFNGSVVFDGNPEFTTFPQVKWDKDSKFGDHWDVFTVKERLSGPQQLTGPLKLKAHIKYRVEDVQFDYTRDIVVGAFEVGSWEKERKLTNDRRVWVPGILMRDHGNWGMSFYLPDGTFIAGASQGNQVMVHDKREKTGEEFTWVSPNDSSLMQGAKCYFYAASDWRGLECRVGEVRVIEHGTDDIPGIKVRSSTDGIVKTEKITDFDATSFEEIKFPDKPDTPLELDVNLPAANLVRGLDIRIADGRANIVIEAYVSGKWIPVYWGAMGGVTNKGDQTMSEIFSDQPDIQRMIKLEGGGGISSVRTFTPVNTNRLKIKISRENGGGTVKLSELRIYKESPSKKA